MALTCFDCSKRNSLNSQNSGIIFIFVRWNSDDNRLNSINITTFYLKKFVVSINITTFEKRKPMKNKKVSEIIKALEEDGWYIKHQVGSHRQFVHPYKAGKVTVNGKNSSDICGSLLKSIEKQSGLEF